MKFRFLISAFFVGVLFLFSCEDEITPVNSGTESVTVTGTLYAWRCLVGDVFNNPPRPFCKFYSFTEESARISFTKDNGPTYVTSTDEASQYEIVLENGFYSVQISTRYTWPPDTFYVEVADYHHNIDFDIVYLTLDADYLAVWFLYSNREDTNMVNAEWQYIRRLNTLMGNILVTQVTKPPDIIRSVYVSDYFNYARAQYLVPIKNDRAHWAQVWPAAEEILRLHQSEFPPFMGVDPWGAYVCMDR